MKQDKEADIHLYILKLVPLALKNWHKYDKCMSMCMTSSRIKEISDILEKSLHVEVFYKYNRRRHLMICTIMRQKYFQNAIQMMSRSSKSQLQTKSF